MRSFLVTGDSETRDNFIKKLIADENILNHNIIYFEEEITIENAKKLKQLLSKRYSEKTIIIITAISSIAQNALLKTIEDIQENVSIIFSMKSASEMLDTIRSRLFLINTGINITRDDENVNIEKLMSSNPAERLSELDNHLVRKTDNSPSEVYEGLIREYRKKLLTMSVENLSLSYLEMIKRLLENYRLVKNNNVNLRFSLESLFI